MMDAIKIQALSKWFDRYDNPRERFFKLFSGNTHLERRHHALQDVTLSIPKGSSFGLVGRNGAGKSTLMQLIAGVMRPSEGIVSVHGRVSPLLELGTGFNPEYTGIENVRLNAAVLGLTPSQVRLKEENIIDFADIGDFINRPVKTYSSGMFARLAFSVAINVDPEILLVDEILSVGDMGFQQKCLNRLREMRQDGLTLVFVSHSADSVKSVCDKAIFLDRGQVMYIGDADQTVDRYLAFIREQSNEDQLRSEKEHPWKRPVKRILQLEGERRFGSGHVQITRTDILNECGQSTRAFTYGDLITIEVEFQSTIAVSDLCVNLLVRDATGLDLFGTSTFDEDILLKPMDVGEKQTVQFTFPAITRVGSYGVALSITRVSQKDYSDSFLFDQVDGICSYSIAQNIKRPVHYKFHVATSITAEASTVMEK
ncbi:ABC transporter ATP-binding protein [Ochrobactrum sp. BTU2]|uniref:ABC transporter ATP-binding protein n=1 Tax=Ochrobactrum sp. BTU2 TaxID=2856166 RepID=UPI002119BF0D|nr:ABC transporter ATP-binding protein [Ochrobactrum sp. BTU2]MCQ9147818.1 ABC transporter ATP-binding protein [Ochrobactrum sp. BTU2]